MSKSWLKTICDLIIYMGYKLQTCLSHIFVRGLGTTKTFFGHSARALLVSIYFLSPYVSFHLSSCNSFSLSHLVPFLHPSSSVRKLPSHFRIKSFLLCILQTPLVSHVYSMCSLQFPSVQLIGRLRVVRWVNLNFIFLKRKLKTRFKKF